MKMPKFYVGKRSSVETAVKNKVFVYPAYVYIRDERLFAFIDKDGSILPVKGDNKTQVVRVDELPSISEADTEVLYICDDIVYTFDGEEYHSAYKDHTAEIEALTAELKEVANKVTVLKTETEEINKTLATHEQLFTRKDYEVVKVPTGTLVDYFNKEIRIMIPADTDFATEENASTTGTDGIFYIETRFYAPEGAVGFRTDVNKIAENEPIKKFNGLYAGTDECGRNYYIIYQPVAYYDTKSKSWVYYGAKSTTAHYVGWLQISEWYDADGKMFVSDAIKINLSNEECHSAIEPYYISEMKTNVEKIPELQEKVETLENTVEEIKENYTVKFIEF